MPDQIPQGLPRTTRLYVLSVASLGALVVGLSVSGVINQPYDWHVQWLSLVALTVVSGLLPVTLPSINISISISETFVVAGTLLFGTAGGTVLGTAGRTVYLFSTCAHATAPLGANRFQPGSVSARPMDRRANSAYPPALPDRPIP